MITKLHDQVADIRARREEGEKGFTLIELLVVVIIIGILAAIAIPIFLGQQNDAKDSAVRSAVTNAKTAIVAASVDTGTFPDSAAAAGIAAGFNGPNFTLTATTNVATGALCVSGTHSETGNTFRATESSGTATGAAC